MKSLYLPLDYNYPNDPKIMKLHLKHGLEGEGFYFRVISLMHQQTEGTLTEEEYNNHAKLLGVNDDIANSLFDCNLLHKEGDIIICHRVLRNKLKIQNIHDVRSYAGKVSGQVRQRPKSKSREFTIPTIEEIGKYCDERKNNVDAQKFHDFYSSKGWLIGKNKMKDWRAAVRTWEQRGGQNETRTQYQEL